MFVDFLNLFQDPANFFRTMPLWAFFALPHVFNLLFLFVVWVANLRTTSDSLSEGTSEDVALFFDGIVIFLGCMAYFVAIDMPALLLSKGIFEVNGVTPGGGSYAYTGGYNNGNVPSVGASLHGGSNTVPQKGIVYQGLPSSGGSFTDSYRSARVKAGMKDGKVATIERNNMKSAAGKPAGNSSSSNSSSNSSSSNNGAAAAGAGAAAGAAAGAVAANKAGNKPDSGNTGNKNDNTSQNGSSGSQGASKSDKAADTNPKPNGGSNGSQNGSSSSKSSGSSSNSSNSSQKSSGSNSNSSSNNSKSGGSSSNSGSSSGGGSKSGGSSSGGSKGGFGGGSKSGGGTSGG